HKVYSALFEVFIEVKKGATRQALQEGLFKNGLLFFLEVFQKKMHLFFYRKKLACFKNQHEPGEERDRKKEKEDDFSKTV
ncbi:MAG: hypothetical protein EBZ47_09905, partial [Chlamydiae bacterium]|nr:hypothetical protein [Chlamydiota bacterium]